MFTAQIVAQTCIFLTLYCDVDRYANTFDTFNRITEILNAVLAHDDTHYYQILGDNFYDQVL